MVGNCGRPPRAANQVKIFPRNVWTSWPPATGIITAIVITVVIAISIVITVIVIGITNHHHWHCHCHNRCYLHDDFPLSPGWTQCTCTMSIWPGPDHRLVHFIIRDDEDKQDDPDKYWY